MTKGFWDTVDEPCFAIEFGNNRDVDELKQEIIELKKVLSNKEVKRIKSIDVKHKLLR